MTAKRHESVWDAIEATQPLPRTRPSPRAVLMSRMFHVTSSKNRASILAHGLDWRLMDASRGIAGSEGPERDGCFLCRGEREADSFVRMNNTGGPVDVWAIDGVEGEDLVESPEGFCYLPTTIPPDRLTLLRTDIPPEDFRSAPRPPGDDAAAADGGDFLELRLIGDYQAIRLRGWRRLALRLLRPAPIRNVIGWFDCSVPGTRGRLGKLREPWGWRED